MSRAAMAEEEIEYESDPEEAKLSLKMRRREASDDEAEEGVEIRANPLRAAEIDDSDGESEGAAAEYEDEYEDEEGYELDEYAEEIVEEVKAASAVERADAGRDGGVTEGLMEQDTRVINDAAGEINEENVDTEDGQQEGENKEIEPFSVPTAGAFYMHDDRFRDIAGVRNRRMLGGRKLWESKDDRKWGHDKFEELTVQDRGSEEHRRGSRGRNRGRGRNRAAVREYAQVNRPRELTNYGTENNDNDSQSSAPKGFRGRGPRSSGKSNEKPSNVSYERISESMSNAEPGVVLPRKQAFASSLNIASPPFYPSASSTKDNSGPNKRDVQAGSVKGGTFGKPANTVQMPTSGPSSINSTHQQFRGQGRGMGSSTQMVYQPVVSNNNQVNRVNPPNQLQTGQRNPGQSRGQSFVQASGQQFTQRVPSGSITSSPPKATGAVNAVESGELEAPSESNKSKNALVSKGKGSVQGNGRGSFLYGGNMGSGHGDPNFPAFLPVMQFGGQHPGGMGVPAVGMAFPGYVGQPQHGRGNSEMTWLPVLTGPAGALGARNWPPYLAVDGSYHARPSGQISPVTAASSKENNSINVGSEWKPAQRPELANDDLGLRQKNPRRQVGYTEMKFDQ
ncbi:hypothetical protein PHJA_002112200 [Phtheirospermum japonicum]|uniref:Btz domain-containing protein n=1 Tax=Phtheirospermum japonicum TaxID=374723 RepID=A0A830D004_9LAMI|nr:hypothetical protein PHJA_002112200 [Phtheirospermum japonicum]